MMSPLQFRPTIVMILVLATVSQAAAAENATMGLAPWSANAWYWSYRSEPVLLLGGSDDDNLFQWPAERLIPHLDRLAEAGGNVIRNTMSDRPDQGHEVYPFLRLDDGRYDLEQFSEEYWQRLERLLVETAQRRIFVQIEVWDRFDYTDQGGSNRWQVHPYNPRNNVNYDYEETGFAQRYPDHPGRNKQPFFFTTPDQRNNQLVLRYQQRFVDRLLDATLAHDHVLYCIDNETSGQEEWGRYWARYIKRRAEDEGQSVMVTEMWDDWDLRAERHRRTFDHPQLYDFVDVSQNNHNRGQRHWDNFLYVRQYLTSHPRPINTTKTYGADGNKFGHTDRDAIERFWRHLLGGAASIRFHRPPSGLGLNDKAVACLRAARKLESRVPLWNVEPSNHLLDEREDDVAYLAARPGQCYAIFFPRGGKVTLDMSAPERSWLIEWIDINTGEWLDQGRLSAGAKVSIQVPQEGPIAATLTAADE